jgi:hypothetical protein
MCVVEPSLKRFNPEPGAPIDSRSLQIPDFQCEATPLDSICSPKWARSGHTEQAPNVRSRITELVPTLFGFIREPLEHLAIASLRLPAGRWRVSQGLSSSCTPPGRQLNPCKGSQSSNWFPCWVLTCTCDHGEARIAADGRRQSVLFSVRICRRCEIRAAEKHSGN